MNEDETVNHLTVGDNCDSPTDNGYFFDGTVDQSTVFMNANGDVMAQVNGALDFTCSGECPGDSITVNGGPPLQADFAGSLPGQIAATNKGCGVSATSLNNYLGTKSSPMVGQGTNLMNSGAQYNLDPRLFVSVAGAETRFGNNITAGQFNAFNVLYNGHNSPFASFQSAINSVGYSLTNPRNGYDLSNTSTMYKTYCSTGSTCAAGLNNVNTFMRQQGANPTSLHYPCKKD
jgi:hypothetical protein